jgi:hypothetical protein
MEALHSFHDLFEGQSVRELEGIVDDVIGQDGEMEDARSLYRAVSNRLVDMV